MTGPRHLDPGRLAARDPVGRRRVRCVAGLSTGVRLFDLCNGRCGVHAIHHLFGLGWTFMQRRYRAPGHHPTRMMRPGGSPQQGVHIGKGNQAVLQEIRDMPPGTLGFEAVGEVDDDDYEKVLTPTLRRWMAERGKIRLLYLLGTRLSEFEGDAISENAKFIARHPGAYERVAVVSDEGWLAPAIKVLSLLLPGEAKAFPVRELPAAKRWLAEGLNAGGSSPAT
jgi:hypothetical protein